MAEFIVQGLAFGIGTGANVGQLRCGFLTLAGLAWAGIGAASGAAARKSHERRVKKGIEDVKDIEKRKVAQAQAEQHMFATAPPPTPGLSTYTPTGSTPD